MDRIMTKTLAEIYVRQGHLQEAYEIFKFLSEKDPSNIEIQKRLKELSGKLKLSPPLAGQPVESDDLQRTFPSARRPKEN